MQFFCRFGFATVLLVSIVSHSLANNLNARCTYTDFRGAKCWKNVLPEVTKTGLLNYLKHISGSNIISGSHISNWFADLNKAPRLLQNMTGAYPGLWSTELKFTIDDVLNRQLLFNETLSQWKSESLVSLKLFLCPPTLQDTCDEKDVSKKLTTDEWTELLTDGSNLNKLWKIRLNSVAPFFKQLELSGVITIFDPMQGINADGSWWGGIPGTNGSQKLYQMTHDHFTGHHRLKSLVWVWSIQHGKEEDPSNVQDYWPGTQYVDVSSIYLQGTKELTGKEYQNLIEISGDKLLSLEMMHYAPTTELLNAFPKLSWFRISDFIVNNSSWNDQPEDFVTKVKNPKIIHQGDIAVFMSKNYALNQTVVSSTDATDEFQAQFAVDGNMKTRWSSIHTDFDWIYIDLGKLQYVKKVKLFWESFAEAYQIQISVDLVSWNIVFEEFHGDGEEDSITFAPVFAKYVKMFVLKRGSGYGNSLYEFEVY